MKKLPALLGLLLAFGGPPLVAVYGTLFARDPFALSTNLVCQLALVALVVAILVIAFIWEGLSPESLGLRRPGLPTLIWALALTAVSVVLLGPLMVRLPGWHGLNGYDKTLGELARLPVWYLIPAVFVGGTVEEVLYRGFAIEHLAWLSGSYAFAGVASTLFFGLAHIPVWGWGPALATTIAGGVFTVAYLWRRDLGALIIAHVASDFAGLVVGPLLA
jgi:uncharacterized protein